MEGVVPPIVELRAAMWAVVIGGLLMLAAIAATVALLLSLQRDP